MRGQSERRGSTDEGNGREEFTVVHTCAVQETMNARQAEYSAQNREKRRRPPPPYSIGTAVELITTAIRQ